MLTAMMMISHVTLGATLPAAGSAATDAASGCPGLDALNPLCQAGSIVGGVASSGINSVLNGLSQWVADGAEWLLAQIGNVLVSTTTINISDAWFENNYGLMSELAAVVLVPLLLVSTMQAIYKQSATQLLRAFFVQLPLALLLGAVAVQIVSLCLSATDAMCAEVAGGSSSAVDNLLTGVSKGLVSGLADTNMSSFVLVLVGLLVAVGAFVLWLELLVRAAAVYVAVLFLPLALATLVWPSISHMCRRLVETLTALIISKFVIVATLSLAASALGSGTAGTGDAGSGFSSVLAGGALLLLATFVPFSILRLIPMVEAGAASHLEGARQRALGPITAGPRMAASYALEEAKLNHRAKKGSAQIAEISGPPGTGAAAKSAAGGADTPTEDDRELAKQSNSANGGLIRGSTGQALGIPRDPDSEPYVPTPYVPHDLGPKPVRGVSTAVASRSAGGAGASGRASDQGNDAESGSAESPRSTIPGQGINPPRRRPPTLELADDGKGSIYMRPIPRDGALDRNSESDGDDS
jgi:hypothetical protein